MKIHLDHHTVAVRTIDVTIDRESFNTLMALGNYPSHPDFELVARDVLAFLKLPYPIESVRGYLGNNGTIIITVRIDELSFLEIFVS